MDRLSSRIYVDSAWSTWEPVYRYVSEDEGLETPGFFPESGSKFEARSYDEDPLWVRTYLEELVRNRQIEKMDLHRLAGSLGISVRALERNLTTIQPLEFGVDDDFKLIEGIGSTFEEVLKKMGYRTFDQLADASPDDQKYIRSRLGRYGSRLDQDKWIEQAKVLRSRKG